MKGDNIMPSKSKSKPKRTELKNIPKSKREMTGKDLRKVKGGGASAAESSQSSKDLESLDYSKIQSDY